MHARSPDISTNMTLLSWRSATSRCSCCHLGSTPLTHARRRETRLSLGAWPGQRLCHRARVRCSETATLTTSQEHSCCEVDGHRGCSNLGTAVRLSFPLLSWQQLSRCSRHRR
eukprot:1994568-Rhodomonas_salina.2